MICGSLGDLASLPGGWISRSSPRGPCPPEGEGHRGRGRGQVMATGAGGPGQHHETRWSERSRGTRSSLRSEDVQQGRGPPRTSAEEQPRRDRETENKAHIRRALREERRKTRRGAGRGGPSRRESADATWMQAGRRRMPSLPARTTWLFSRRNGGFEKRCANMNRTGDHSAVAPDATSPAGPA
jgi:hypothetical protein